MLGIKNNLMADAAARHLGKSYNALSTSVERLSSGLRINSAKDDAAGMAVRELIRADIASLRQGSRNAADAVSMLQSAEGGLGVMDDVLIRMRELAEQASTGSYSSDQRAIMQQEFDELADEVTRIANSTDFNGNNLLTVDTADAVEISLGNGLAANQTIEIDKHNVTAAGLGIGGLKETFTGRQVDAASDNYVTNAANAARSLIFTFDTGGANGGAQTLSLAFSTSETKSLTTTVTELNALSRGAVAGWDAASADYNASTGTYALKLEYHESGQQANTTVTGHADLTWHADAGATNAVATADFQTRDGTGSALSIEDLAAVQTSITAIDSAINEKDQYRAHLGYMMNRLQSATQIIDVQAENLLAAESRISDVDVAIEMAAMTRNQVLAQAGVSMLSQANQMPQMAMKLLG